ncbi:MAG: hypothetical protein H7222_17415 [Methylotenera sp.]|nr:hypothetical protein [Oligoflexia bacterium]
MGVFMTFSKSLSAVRLALSSVVLFAAVAAQANTLPPNNLGRQDHLFGANGTEAEFNQVIDEVIAEYQPIVKAHGATLTIERLWKDTTVNASASQTGNEWQLHMYGGLFRRPEMNHDGFAAVVCHELGHHLGGFPVKVRFGSTSWAADEGEADYFATQVCLKRIWNNDLANNAAAAKTAPKAVINGCNAAYSNKGQRDLCYRIANAGLPLAQLLATLNGTDPKALDVTKTDKAVVSSTFQDHPQAQCRLDTYFQGAICGANFDPNVIPGKGNPKGDNSLEAEQVSAHYSCTKSGNFKAGLRPTCWFKPRM